MLFLSLCLLRSHTKRITVILKSAAQTNYAYFTDKSPSKANVKLALRKYDPVVNRHVMFYESPLPPNKRGQRIMIPRAQKYARLTGRNVGQLVKRVERAWEKGRFSDYNKRDLPRKWE